MAELVQIPKEEYERLRERETLFLALSDSASIMLWIAGQDGYCTWFNRSWLDFRGRTLQEEIGNGWTQGVHQDDVHWVMRYYLDAFEKKIPFHLRYRLLRKDGIYCWILENGVPRYGASGEFLGYIGTCIDITETELSRIADRETSKRLAELGEIVESSDDVILSKDLNGIITSWNATATKVFGYTAEEIIGKSILTLIPEDLHSDENTILENIRAGRRVEHFETLRKAKDGRLIEVSLTVSPVRDKDGHIIGASKILRDISDRKRIEQSLVQAEKLAATGRMAATIAHEINNPLEALMNLIYLARSNTGQPEVADYLDTAEHELKRVSHIAKQTLGYYREHAAAKPVSLAEIVEQTVEMYAPRCLAANIRVELQAATIPRLTLRRGEMMQVFSNLIMNSIYAMPEGGFLHVIMENTTAPHGVAVTIADTGIGISDKNLPHVFDAFFTTRSTIGTGIGLFISKQFVEGHGGSITIASSDSQPARGTEVRVFLPLQTRYELEPSAQ